MCDACQRAKSHQLLYPKSTSISNHLLELVFSDVWGPTPDSTRRYKYYVIFVDDYSKFTWIYLLKFKSEVFHKFRDIQNLIERLFDRKILAVQTDCGGEYEALHPFFTKIGISHFVSCPHAHQQNGPAERKHRHIVEVGLSLLSHAHMPLKFWDEAFLAAMYLINRTPSKVINFTTPIERQYDTKPDYSPSEFLGVLVGHISDHITSESLNSDQRSVFSLGIVNFIKVSNVSMSKLEEFIYHAMWCLMKISFCFQNSMPMQELDFVKKSYFYPHTS
jgi:histone deacetylase 1/2